MKSRHRAREVAFQILYRYDQAGIEPPQGTALASELSQHFDHFQVPDGLREFSAQLVAGSLSKRAELDERLEKHASNWKIPRMSSVDRSLLRLAIYEMLHMPQTPPAVVIDEAIELGKQFGTAETSGFLNGVLDAIRNSLPKAQG